MECRNPVWIVTGLRRNSGAAAPGLYGCPPMFPGPGCRSGCGKMRQRVAFLFGRKHHGIWWRKRLERWYLFWCGLEKRQYNRQKHYVIPEGHAVPFLVDLGVQTQDGKIVKSRYDKFRQINRFLEFIEDILPKLDKTRENVIIDFGCGKSYLTFAMYYYLHEMKGYPIRIIGLD